MTGWSTRELAELAGTTVNTVRHYHQRGLLDEPHRRVNGYKQYGVAHLVRLLQIRRLRDIGVPIAEISRLGAGVGTSADVLAEIDAELVATIERSHRVRAEIAAMIEHGTTSDVARGFEGVASRLSDAERSLTLIYSQLYDGAAMDDVRAMVEAAPDAADTEFEALAPDAPEEVRARLAQAFAVSLAKAITDYPWLNAPTAHLQKSADTTRATFIESVVSLYNPAQLDVLGRASTLAQRIAGQGSGPA